VGCHRPEYATVLRWWTQGTRERAVLVEGYVRGAEAALSHGGESDPARLAVARARQSLEAVSTAGSVHNITLSHTLLQEALAAAGEAYEAVGRRAPASPQLGRAPRQGICAYCHYGLQEPGFSDTMDDAFHREVLGSGS
jgi:hypothetical protein